MNIKKAVIGKLDITTPDSEYCIWLEGTRGEIVKLATFVDEEAYRNFLKCLETGFFAPPFMSHGPKL